MVSRQGWLVPGAGTWVAQLVSCGEGRHWGRPPPLTSRRVRLASQSAELVDPALPALPPTAPRAAGGRRAGQGHRCLLLWGPALGGEEGGDWHRLGCSAVRPSCRQLGSLCGFSGTHPLPCSSLWGGGRAARSRATATAAPAAVAASAAAWGGRRAAAAATAAPAAPLRGVEGQLLLLLLRLRGVEGQLLLLLRLPFSSAWGGRTAAAAAATDCS